MRLLLCVDVVVVVVVLCCVAFGCVRFSSNTERLFMIIYSELRARSIRTD